MDSSSVEFYDCIYSNKFYYCRRPSEPFVLNRSNDKPYCYNNGIAHSFAQLQQKNINVSTIFEHWNSSVEMAEQYQIYLTNNTEYTNGYICECINAQSFGKFCEYLLPFEYTFEKLIEGEYFLKANNSHYVQLYGDIICHETLKCDSLVLCLDWREICDGVQQCILGIDEENCDFLELNECENDEYRCMNGMCIPEEYFVDGEFDCLDWSDEMQYYDDGNCPLSVPSSQCDDRICPPNQFSCGDGQCIVDRFDFQTMKYRNSECPSRREQYFLCETHFVKDMWSLPNGRCYEDANYTLSNLHNLTNDERCVYILQCDLSGSVEKDCPCVVHPNYDCDHEYNKTCSSQFILFPRSGLMAEYIFLFYPRAYQVQPDHILINGTIKCNGQLVSVQGMKLTFKSQLHEIENDICQQAINVPNNTYKQCYSQSFTLNNRSSNAIQICKNSSKCISIYRIKDGFDICDQRMDVLANLSIDNLCAHQHRFRCSSNEFSCLNIGSLGNNRINCENKYDEFWFDTEAKLMNINCNSLVKDQCETLREYLRTSWLDNHPTTIKQQLRISFRQYCDTFWHLADHNDENLNECKQWWQCPTGQCIQKQWVLDDEWDCADGSDEAIFHQDFISERNRKILSWSQLKNKSFEQMKSLPFASLCNLTIEFPCLIVNDSYSWKTHPTDSRPCFNRYRLGDNQIDCYGAIDERNTQSHCQQATMLAYNYKCQSTSQCIPFWKHCLQEYDRCDTRADDHFWCVYRNQTSQCDRLDQAVCFNGTCVDNGRCNRIIDCLFGEDEYMCDYVTQLTSSRQIYREIKQLSLRKSKEGIRSIEYPLNMNKTMTNVIYSCNRGVGVRLYNDSMACFCPTHYYGDKCQYHADRIVVRLHFDFRQSIYAIQNDVTIVLKMLIVFLYNDEILMSQLAHVRPTTDLESINKRFFHFVYSHSSSFGESKRQRYFNRTGLIHDHPYSIRIELYERQASEKPLLVSVWQYPIYFDYLPVYHFSKVLRLIQSKNESNACSSNPCHPNQDCQIIRNAPWKCICLCKSHFMGKNCSEEDHFCANNYCANNSLCKVNYRGRLAVNEYPYCLCPFDKYGERCHLKYDQCSSNPCHNNGSCFPSSSSDGLTCKCTKRYEGSRCQLKKAEIQLYFNESLDHGAVVIQYFQIDFNLLNLKIARQEAYLKLARTIMYEHDKHTAPELILIKVYSSNIVNAADLYLLNVTMISGPSQLNEHNHCHHVRSLINEMNVSPIRYHSFCRTNLSLYCFHDDYYLCLCDENHLRVECFRYDSKIDQCDHCKDEGRCLKANRSQGYEFLCLCSSCHSGSKCQFNWNSFAFTLDQFFFGDLISHEKSSGALRTLILMPLLMFLLALPNNICSFVTFRQPRCLCNGVGQYLLYMSVIDQLNLSFLACRLIHLGLSMTGQHSYSSVDNYLCKIFNYFLDSSSRMVYWLSSLIAIERLYMTLFLNGRWLRKPEIARRLIVLLVISILVTDIHELIFVKSESDIHHAEDSMCVIDFPLNSHHTWLLYHQIISIINSILPLGINLCCTIVICIRVAKNKFNTRQTIIVADGNQQRNQSRWTHFRTQFSLIVEVFKENKELIVGPAITLVPQLFSLPLFIVSFTISCQNLENIWIRYPLIVSYFITFIPQQTSFLLYVVPSTFYITEWYATKLSKGIIHCFRSNQSKDVVVSKIFDALELVPTNPTDDFRLTLNSDPKSHIKLETELNVADLSK